jgi:hypothetical protein
MKKLIIALIAWTTFTANALEFKGIEIGKKTTVQEVQDKLGGTFSWGRTSFRGQSTIGGEAAEISINLDENSAVKSIFIRLEPRQFAKVAEALKGKYKAPKIEREVLQTAFGVNVENISMSWTVERGCEVFAEKYSGSIDKSLVLYHCDSDKDIEKAEEKNKKSKNDL